MDTQRHKLFQKHSQDLKQLYEVNEFIFACPICLDIYEANGIETNEVSVGHVWPEYIRKGNKKASKQKILLCTSCNSSAGSNADFSMQEFEKLNDAKKSGALTAPPRRAQIIQTNNPGKKIIGTKLYIETKEENVISFSLEIPKTNKQRKNNQVIMRKIVDYFSEGPISIISAPTVDFNLARVGWLTSAYLLAFYNFGYRYILQSCLDPVRHQIRQSFQGITDNSLSYSEEKVMLVARCNPIICEEPEIGALLPLNQSKMPYIFVNFRDIHIRMPVRLHYTIISNDEPTASVLDQKLVIYGNDHEPHIGFCQWEEGFGEPEYKLVSE